ncbi:hypothetical protein KEK_18323 [Mycolicibacterium thermoresistibile ATCC 19527]|uniref:Uncharacterized protein n=2 Tax=Mycolicibacterium thermoresistibile TaxID=1797 RepID=G7CK95_MYCT3|nr:hypothetical protein KEK_18323 [Mycolicibacterium thermoresistibile ATCC 19527]
MRVMQLKLVSAAVGVGALIAMGALGLTFGAEVGAAQPEPPSPGPVTTTAMTTGESAVPEEGSEEEPEESPESPESAGSSGSSGSSGAGGNSGKRNGPTTSTAPMATPPVTAERPDGFDTG